MSVNHKIKKSGLTEEKSTKSTINNKTIMPQAHRQLPHLLMPKHMTETKSKHPDKSNCLSDNT